MEGGLDEGKDNGKKTRQSSFDKSRRWFPAGEKKKKVDTILLVIKNGVDKSINMTVTIKGSKNGALYIILIHGESTHRSILWTETAISGSFVFPM